MKACESRSVKLSALADGELTGWAAWRLRRHIARCAACAQELKLWHQMQADVCASDPLASLLPDAAEDRSPTHHFIAKAGNLRAHRAILPTLALAGGVLAALVAGALFTGPSQQDSPQAARAAVIEGMFNVRTAEWHTDTQIFDRKTGKVACYMSQDIKARLDPPAIYEHTQTLQQPTTDKTDPSGQEIVLVNTTAWTIYRTGSKDNVLSVHRVEKHLGPPKHSRESLYQRVRRAVADDIFRALSPDATQERNTLPKPDIDGFTKVDLMPPSVRLVIHHERRVLELQEAYTLLPNDNMIFRDTLWADPHSYRIEEAEDKNVGSKVGTCPNTASLHRLPVQSAFDCRRLHHQNRAAHANLHRRETRSAWPTASLGG